MERPFSDERPIGPLISGGGDCTLRFKTTFKFDKPPDEVERSLKVSINNKLADSFGGLGKQIRVDNLTITQSGRQMEIGYDLPFGTADDELEDEMLSSIAAALIEGGAEGPQSISYEYNVVSR